MSRAHRRSLLLSFALAACGCGRQGPAVESPVDRPREPSPTGQRLVYIAGSTKKVCQLTGDLDRQTGRPTRSLTNQRAGVRATDLGSSFEHDGRLVFLFGDTHGKPGDRDALASTISRDPEQIDLDFLRGDDGTWRPLEVPGVSLGAFEVPSHGVSLGGKMYVLFTTDHTPQRTMGRSVLAVSTDGGRQFRRLYDFSTTHFINVAFWKSDDWLYAFGSGEYRRSSVRLARIRPADVERAAAWEYLADAGPDGMPRWSHAQPDAAPLFHHDVVGELSVAYCPSVERYVLLYNSGEPRGIVMRSAAQPWGPWSDAAIIFDPWQDGGYGHFLHIAAGFRPAEDGLSDPGREAEWGGEYGPFVMPRYTTGNAACCRIYYTMSTWNPYQVVVMQSDLRLEAEHTD
ncbi:MAG: DUF4185 domain-containing protein [Gemmataceae bacterium]